MANESKEHSREEHQRHHRSGECEHVGEGGETYDAAFCPDCGARLNDLQVDDLADRVADRIVEKLGEEAKRSGASRQKGQSLLDVIYGRGREKQARADQEGEGQST